ncbi:MAG: PhzF family phenazine biosynthesis protein [Enterocloster citroniae]|nr:PhzF family phenazine biosynthesis protein [Enterocloster citroniae]
MGDFFNKGSESLIKSGLKIPRSYYGIKEESATGTSNCALACYLYRYGLKQPGYVFEQGRNLNSISRIYVRVEGGDDAVSGVSVGGYGYVEGSKTAAV